MAQWSWSAAVRSGNVLNLGGFVEAAKEAGGGGAHVDVGDGRFYPGFGVGTDVAAALAQAGTVPVDLHVQVADADGQVGSLLELGCASVTVHVECLTHAHRALAAIREAGIQAGLAIGPGTPLTALEYLLPSVDRVLLVARDPGASAGALPAAAFERVRIMRENADYHNRKVVIEVEGATDAREIAQLIGHGAHRIVIDDPQLLRGEDVAVRLKDFVEEIAAQAYVA